MGTNRGVSAYLKNIWKFQNLAEASLKMLMRIQLTFQDLIKNDEELPTSKKRNYFFIDHDTENRIHTLAATESDGSLPLRELRYRPPQKKCLA